MTVSAGDMQAALADIDRLPSTGKTGAFTALLDRILQSNADDQAAAARQLVAFVRAVIQDSVALVVSKQVVAVLVKRLTDGAISDREAKQDAARGILEALLARQASFEEQTASLRELLADALEQEEEWSEAAKMLQGIPFESSNRTVTDEYKLKMYVRIVRLLLEDNDTVSAQSYLSRAQNLIRLTNDQETILGFKLSQARIYDSQRKFPEAASKYHEISYVPAIDAGERLQMLSAAVTCAILSAAGPRRSRLLATLYRDERSAQLPNYKILSAMFLDRIIKPKETAQFAESLADHQKAKLGPSSLVIVADDEEQLDEDDDEEVETGESDMQIGEAAKTTSRIRRKQGPENVLDKAIMEHNLLSASLIYSNITLSGLGKLLSLTKGAAEAMARTMIIQGRLKGATIDQVEGLITFERAENKDEKTESGSSNVAAAAAAAASLEDGMGTGELPPYLVAPETARWDSRIRKTAQLTEDLAVRCSSLMTAIAVAS